MIHTVDPRANSAISGDCRDSANCQARDVMLGRQPIYDINRTIHGYELLFRSGSEQTAGVLDGDSATAQVIVNAVSSIGIETIAPSELLFINCTRRFLQSDPVLPAGRFVLEVLENIEVDEDLLSRLRALREAGYKIALDDFVLTDKTLWAVKHADYIKLDVMALSEPELRRHVDVLRRRGVKLIAEKIESEDQLTACHKLGFDLFQGYYLRRPDVLNSKRLATNRIAGLRVLAECQDPKKSLAQIAATVSSDVGLTYGLLRLANSGMFGSRVRIESVAQAVGRLGTELVIRWTTLLVLASTPGCPTGYVQCALQRAYMCDLLATKHGLEPRESFFLVGLLSTLDSITGSTMAHIMESLPLAENVKFALLRMGGEPGKLLDLVLKYENGDWASLQESSYSRSELCEAYWSSAKLAREAIGSLSLVKK